MVAIVNPLTALAAAEACGEVPEGTDLTVLTGDPVRWRTALLANIELINTQVARLKADEAAYRSEWHEDTRAFHQTVAKFLEELAQLVELKAKVDTRLREVKLLLTPDQRDTEFRVVGAEKNRWRRLSIWLLGEMDDIDDIEHDVPGDLRGELGEALTAVADAERRTA